MATEDMVQQEAPEQESHWQALPWLLGGLAGLSALVVAIGAGLWADNDAVTILIRAVIAMGTCWMAGWGAGWLEALATEENGWENPTKAKDVSQDKVEALLSWMKK